jgi:glycosyltransferase involved in cell wall biosynthesis
MRTVDASSGRWRRSRLCGTAPRVLRVALVRDFDEPRLFGVRLYAERVRRALTSLCELVDVYPWPRRSRGPAALRAVQTLLVKELLYPLRVRGVRADVAHVVDQSHAHLVRRLGGCATVVSCHDLWGLRHGSALRRFGYRRRVRHLRRAARVVAVSEAARREAIDLGVETRRIAVVRNRVDAFFLTPPPVAELRAVAQHLQLESAGFYLHVGNSLPYKNIEGLLRALGELGRRRGRALTLVKVGAEPTAEQQRLAARQGVQLRCVGEVPTTHLRALYHLAECLVYPSLYEGFGWPVAEALACGLPVVAGASGAIPEIAGDAALLVDPTRTSEIVYALERIADDPALRDHLTARGKERGAELARGDVGAELLEVYAAAAAERSTA